MQYLNKLTSLLNTTKEESATEMHSVERRFMSFKEEKNNEKRANVVVKGFVM